MNMPPKETAPSGPPPNNLGAQQRSGDPPANATSLLIVADRTIRAGEPLAAARDRTIQQLAFMPSGTHIIARQPMLLPELLDNTNPPAEGTSELLFFTARDGAPVTITGSSFFSGLQQLPCAGDFAVVSLPDDAVAAAHLRHEVQRSATTDSRTHRPVASPRFYTLDLAAKKRRLKLDDVVVGAPLAYTPNGLHFAGVSTTDPSRIDVFDFLSGGVRLQARCRVPHHVGHVTHLAWMPDGASLVSLSRDGTGRLTSVATGRTIRKFAVETRHPPRLLRLSPDGELVASVWGWEVVLWYPSTGRTVVYDLNAARQSEGWPLCISPNCRYLCCRTEDGFDIIDLLTGRFMGEARGITGDKAGYVSAAAFNTAGDLIVVGKSTGEITTFSVVVA